MKRTEIICAIAVLLLLLGGNSHAQLQVATSPEEVGLSGHRLARLDRVMQGYIDDKELAGCVMLIARKGKIAYHKALGMADIEHGVPMKKDAIFRIASMSKPITSAAVMMLYEEGKFLLSEPVSEYIPEFKSPSVIVPGKDGSYTIEPARREITVRHLLNHTSGISYQWSPVVGKLYHDANVTHGLVQDSSAIVQKMKVLAKIPLVNHPGEAWEYGLNIDVLGALVEVWSGKSFDEFLRERIFEPLGMKDTYFFLPEDKVSRMATVYAPGDEEGMKRWPDTPVIEGTMIYTSTYPYKGPKTYFSGGGGLSSTAEDYARFLQAMLNKGKFDGTRILSRKTVELMTTSSIGDMHILGRPGFKFGLGFSVLEAVDQGSELESVGNFGWGGFWYTHTLVDPGEEMVAVFMAQLKNAREPIMGKFVVLATQAIAD